jgi:hypothetical protein
MKSAKVGDIVASRVKRRSEFGADGKKFYYSEGGITFRVIGDRWISPQRKEIELKPIELKRLDDIQQSFEWLTEHDYVGRGQEDFVFVMTLEEWLARRFMDN